MAEFPDITLHYFDLRGRGQFIRALLTQREVPFTDDRVKLAKDNSNWPQIRGDRNVTGDFQKFPFLQWGDLPYYFRNKPIRYNCDGPTTFTAFVRVDTTNAEQEVYEDNNYAEITFTLPPAPPDEGG